MFHIKDGEKYISDFIATDHLNRRPHLQLYPYFSLEVNEDVFKWLGIIKSRYNDLI